MDDIQEKKQAPEPTKERIPVYLYPATIREIVKTMELANCKSRSEFLENAANFYAGYIATQNGEGFLSPVLLSAMRAALNDSEVRIARLLFKLAVEVSMMMNVIADTADIDEDTLRKLRGKCVNDVKKTRGAVSFDDAVRYQTVNDPLEFSYRNRISM